MKIIAFSDVHGQHRDIKIPECDVLIFAGDYSWESDLVNSLNFFEWFREQPGQHKILVPGNHDTCVDIPIWEGINVLINDELVIKGVKFFGSPYTPIFNNWYYMKPEEELRRMYDTFPTDIEVLITHGPAYGVLDKYDGKHIGSKALSDFFIKNYPRYHIFGHNHEAGHIIQNGTNSYNVAMCNQEYKLIYPLTIIDL